MLTTSTVLAPETRWTFKDAQTLIKGLQASVKPFGYHVCLGGSVLNDGSSRKDLDLFFLPLDSGKPESSPEKLLTFLEEVWGKGISMLKTLGKTRWQRVTLPDGSSRVELVDEPEEEKPYPTSSKSPYSHKLIFSYSGLRVDVFIAGPAVQIEDAKLVEEPRTVDPQMVQQSNAIIARLQAASRHALQNTLLSSTSGQGGTF